MRTYVSADLQIACDTADVPAKNEIEGCLSAVLSEDRSAPAGALEISIRVVDEAESQALNLQYRGMDRPTNVLSFPLDLPDVGVWPEGTPVPLGDLVICAPVVAREAGEQGKDLAAHWTHMLVHGMLHLLGYDHETEIQAETMESLEIRILQTQDVKNPYEDNGLT